METINIEQGHPSVLEAKQKLMNGLYRARASGKPFAKIIHGYGSSGTGGAIKAAIGAELRSYKMRGMIKSFSTGEDFGPFSAEGRAMAAAHKEITRDIDWGRNNDGITVVIFK